MLPVLPQGLRKYWQQVPVRDYMREILWLPEDATYSSLNGDYAVDVQDAECKQITSALAKEITKQFLQVKDVYFFTEPIPAALKVNEMNLQNRTVNAMTRSGIFTGLDLQIMTIGDFVRIRGFSVYAILDLAAGYENHMRGRSMQKNYSTNTLSRNQADRITSSQENQDLGNRQVDKSGSAQSDKSADTISAATDPSSALLRQEKQRAELQLQVGDAEKYIVDAIGEDWSFMVSEADPRFTDLFPPGVGTIDERYERLSERKHYDWVAYAELIIELASAIGSIRKRVGEINEQPLEEAFEYLLRNMSRARHIKVLESLIARLGLGGAKPVTLQAAGDMANLTRERIRQLESNLLAFKPNNEIYMPKLRVLLDLIGQQRSMTIDAAARIAIDKGLANVEIHFESLKAMARFCGTPIDEWKPVKDLLIPDLSLDDTLITRIATGLSRGSGIANFGTLCMEVSTETRSQESQTLQEHKHTILDILRVSDFMLFNAGSEDLDNCWFSVDDPKNRLITVVRKILSVTNLVSVKEIREGLERIYRFRNSTGYPRYELVVPPTSILREYFGDHSDFEIDSSDRVRSIFTLDYRNELVGTESVLVEAMRSFPSRVIERGSLWEECEKRGMNPTTFNVYSSYSPVLKQVRYNVWSLRGVEVDAASVQAVSKANTTRGRKRRTKDYGWTEAGRIYIETYIPERADLIPSLVIGIPSDYRDFFDTNGKFPAEDMSGHEFQQIGFSSNGENINCHNFGTFLNRRGAEANDIFRVEFDLETRTAYLDLRTGESATE